MIRPNKFGFNIDTQYTNPFQNKVLFEDDLIVVKAKEEFNQMVEILESHEIEVLVYDDQDSGLPDSVFVNNWITVLPEKKIVLFPMHTENRRSERRGDIIQDLKTKFEINEVIDLSYFENDNLFLESTGSVVFDYVSRVAYASLSKRTNEEVFRKLCELIGFEGFVFSSFDIKGTPIYHTNVVLTIGQHFAILCSDSIEDVLERSLIKKKLEASGKEVIEISISQMNNFAGNCFEVINKNKEPKLIMSRTAFHIFNQKQIVSLEKYVQIIQVNISIIERIGGGSTRCMMMGVNV